MKHGTPNQKQDAMNVWIANISTTQFEVCLRESRTFDGPHSNIMMVRNACTTLLIMNFTIFSGM